MSTGVHQYEDKLLDFAYGELPANEAAAVDAHVRTCAKCGQALAQIKGVRSVFGPLPMVAAPEAGLDSLLGYAEQHARRNSEKKAPAWRTWIFGLASAAALIVVGVVAVRASEESPSTAKEIVAKKLRAEEGEPGAPAPAVPVADAPRSADPAALAGEAQQNVADNEKLVWEDAQQGKRGALEARNKVGAKVDEVAKAELAKDAKTQDLTRTPPAEEPAVLTPPANRGMDTYKTARDVPLQAAKKAETKPEPVEKEAAEKGSVAGAGRGSESKRTADRLDDNWSNVGVGLRTEESKRQQADQLNDGTAVKQSMNAGSSNNRPLGFGVSAGVGVEQQAALDKNVEGSREAARPPPPPPPAVTAGPQPAPAKAKSSYGLPSSMPPSMPSSQTSDDEAMTESVTRSGDADAAKARQIQQTVNAQLAQARAAGQAGDRRGEAIAAIGALNAGATSYDRAEALKRTCDAYEALGEFDRARPYCDRLLAEFSGTAAARQVVDRRKAQLKAPAPTRKNAYEADQAESKPAEATTGQAY